MMLALNLFLIKTRVKLNKALPVYSSLTLPTLYCSTGITSIGYKSYRALFALYKLEKGYSEGKFSEVVGSQLATSLIKIPSKLIVNQMLYISALEDVWHDELDRLNPTVMYHDSLVHGRHLDVTVDGKSFSKLIPEDMKLSFDKGVLTSQSKNDLSILLNECMTGNAIMPSSYSHQHIEPSLQWLELKHSPLDIQLAGSSRQYI